jgi:site-specific recombinase XerD
MPSHKSTAQGRAAAATLADPESLVRFVELLKLRSLAPSTQAEYVRYLRKLAAHVGHDPAQLDEAQVRAYVLHLKTAHKYSPSSMRTACAALQNVYVKLYNRDWKLFDLVRSPDDKKLPAVLTRAEIARLFTTVREPRFQMVLRLIYACGLRISEAIKLEVTDIKKDGPRLYVRKAKGRNYGKVAVMQRNRSKMLERPGHCAWRTQHNYRFSKKRRSASPGRKRNRLARGGSTFANACFFIAKLAST